jgi:hypothetical protein
MGSGPDPQSPRPGSLVLRAVTSHDAAVAFGVLVFLAVFLVVALIALTAVGAHRRGRGNGAAVASGLVFPFTWAAWYLVDERPGSDSASSD